MPCEPSRARSRKGRNVAKQLTIKIEYGDGDYNDDKIAELSIDIGETIERPALSAIAARAVSGLSADVDKYLRTVTAAASVKAAFGQLETVLRQTPLPQQSAARPPAVDEGSRLDDEVDQVKHPVGADTNGHE